MVTSVSDLQAPSRPTPVGELDDRALVLAFKDGSPDAYPEIFERYRLLAYHICFRILGDREDALEATQETMLRVLRGLPVFNGRYQLQAWVARIAKNVSVDQLRSRSRRPTAVAGLDEAERGGAIGVDEDLDELIQRILKQDEVREVLEALPSHHREALVLREIEGRSHAEIADSMGMTSAQAKALIHRAKGSFRRAWGDGGSRHGLAAIVPFILAPLRLPAFLKRIFEPARDAVAHAGTSAAQAAQQAAVTATAAPTVAQTAVTTADRLTAAAITVLVAGSATVGAVAINHRSRPEPKPTPSVASAPATAPSPAVAVTPVVNSRPKDPKVRAGAPTTEAEGEQAPETDATADGSTEPGAVAEPSPGSDPEPGSGTPADPVPTPPAPDWAMGFDSTIPVGVADLALVASHVSGAAGHDMTFAQTASGPTVDPKGDPFGNLYVDVFGWVQGDASSVGIWVIVDSPAGRYRYQADGRLQGTLLEDDGSITYSFTAPYHVVEAPVVPEGTPTVAMPNAGVATLTLTFWADGTSLYAPTLSLREG